MAEVLSSGQGVYTPNHLVTAASGHRYAAIAVAEHHVQSSLIVPLRAQGKLLGTLHANAPVPHAFVPAQLLPLQLLADHAAAAIERVQLTAALARSVQETRAIFDATTEAMALFAPDGRLLSVNQRFEAVFELRETALRGRTIAEFQEAFMHIFAGPAVYQLLVEQLTDPTGRRALDVRQHWPEQRELALESFPVYRLDAELVGRLFAFRDVTAERAADRMKDEFVSLVSHELRTPLTSIKGYVDLLLDGAVGPIPADQREFLEIIQRNADREVTLVNDLLDLARIEAGQVELALTRLNLGPILEHVVTSLQLQCTAKKQQVTLDRGAPLPAVMGDATRLTQVFTNLLSNAHKYTPSGGQIAVIATADDAHVHVDVRDSGIGLSPEEQTKLFTKFFRAKHHITQESGGTGLGLAITRTLVERHGGTITVTSAPDAGSTFRVTLPRAADPTGEGATD